MDYKHTHASVRDDSPAMFVSRTDDTITLVNEDGHQWTDPLDRWRPIGPDYAALAEQAEKDRQSANARYQEARAASQTAALRELVFTAASYGVTRLMLEPSDQGPYMAVSEIEPEVDDEAHDIIWDAGAYDLTDYTNSDWAEHDGVEVEQFSHRDDQIQRAAIDVKVAAEALLSKAQAEPIWRMQALDTNLTVHRSGGSDGAVVVQIDTSYEPDASDGGPGLRVNVNDGDAFVGVPYAPVDDEDDQRLIRKYDGN